MIETRDRGFSLGGYSYGEGDRLILFFTRDMGKIKAAVKGVRKTGSKLSSLTELFNESDIVFARRPGSEIHRLVQGRLLNSRPRLKARLPSLTALQVMADILRTTLPEADPQAALYDLTLKTLDRLGVAGDRPEAALTGFILRFLDLGGYPLGLDRCCHCGGSPLGGGRLSVRRGGFVCDDCGAPTGEGPRLTKDVRALMRKLRSEVTGKIPAASAGAAREAFATAGEYLSFTLEHELPTIGYFLRVTETP